MGQQCRPRIGTIGKAQAWFAFFATPGRLIRQSTVDANPAGRWGRVGRVLFADR